MKALIESTERLYADIDRCISQLVKAREYHDPIAHEGALLQMESLMCATMQQLQCLLDKLKEETK